jgi:hypothetical protein
MYNYIVSGSRLVELTSDNINNYMDKTVKMRFSTLCKCKNGICNKCAGNMFKRLGIENVGVAESQVASTLKNKSMKNFHDSTISTVFFDAEYAFK